ncbi:transport-associated protein [Psychromonas ingrahamii 37]|uniref:Transport-associated protein n=1 Tax=Psychromonas ingrahamii (strain DSM 17664 / CCUG 51855 / 37) TaxID=357804 RepID=A1SWG4_PSYIN|nr:BON domain-containing protein [Psychromonas ingrahamii]ABM03829.1 transport-associated protein [Psychromonas ingrahamii 37]
MKNSHKLLVLSATLISAIVLTGCNNQEDIAAKILLPTKIISEVNDSDVNIRIKAALFADQALKYLEIKVQTHKGDVLLTGEVDSQNRIDHVNKLVMSIKGVHTTHNHLIIKTS